MDQAEQIDRLRDKAAAIGARVERGITFLEDLRKRSGQDTPEFNRYFGEWEKLLAQEGAILEELERAERSAQVSHSQEVTAAA